MSIFGVNEQLAKHPNRARANSLEKIMIWLVLETNNERNKIKSNLNNV